MDSTLPDLTYNQSRHELLRNLYKARNITTVPNPIWKMNITQNEFDQLKCELRQASDRGELEKYNVESAIYYAEWWRREYDGGTPSKEAIARSAGIADAEALYRAARRTLETHSFKIISVNLYRQYFRTLLVQGGIPVNYVTSGANLTSYSAFLAGLVRELSLINFDWNEGDSSIVRNLDCIAQLPKSFQNESIYDVSMQIAHAIIANDVSLLPYDSGDQGLAKLTRSLQGEYARARNEIRTRPLSISWRLSFDAENRSAELYYSLDPVKEIGSESIPQISPDDCPANCYSFEVIMAGKVVAKYSRYKMETDRDTGVVTRAIYSRINLGVVKPVLWKGEQTVNIRIRRDDVENVYRITLPGSCPPDFSVPQVFKHLEGNIYSKVAAADQDNTLAVFTSNWKHPEAKEINLYGSESGHSYLFYSESVSLTDSETKETLLLRNNFTPYFVEYLDTYVPWLENSNFKICTGVPGIRVYDENKKIINKFDTQYRVHGSIEWKRCTRNTQLPQGLVQFRVNLPDGNSEAESFYCIGRLALTVLNRTSTSSSVAWLNAECARIEMEPSDSLIITRSGNNWEISEREGNRNHPSMCAFRFYKEGMPALRIEIPLPFEGLRIINSEGCTVPSGKIISYSNIPSFKIVSQGQQIPAITVSYHNGDDDSVSQKIKRRIQNGITSLSDFTDEIDRMFNIYCLDPFPRKESVSLSVGETKVYVRKFVLESEYDGEILTVLDKTEADESGRYPAEDRQTECTYRGRLLAYPLSDNLTADQLEIFALERTSDESNKFSFSQDFPADKAIVFSDIPDLRKIVPKFFQVKHKRDGDQALCMRNTEQEASYNGIASGEPYGPQDINQRNENDTAREKLEQQNIFTGEEWKKAYMNFVIASKYRLPFKTFPSLRVIASSPELTSKFILGMWYQGHQNILVQDISDFEQEFAIGVHWIRHEVWANIISEFMDYVEKNLESVKNIMIEKFTSGFMLMLKSILTVTTGLETADKFMQVVSQGMDAIPRDIGMLSNAEVQEIKSKTVGATDTYTDLPRTELTIHGNYYREDDMKYYYRMMLNSPICAAEYFCSIDGCLDLWDESAKEQRRVINFYRHYFRSQYSRILLRALGVIRQSTIINNDNR